METYQKKAPSINALPWSQHLLNKTGKTYFTNRSRERLRRLRQIADRKLRAENGVVK